MSREAVVHIVDDDRQLREALRFLFNSAGLKVKTYASAEGFLKAAPTDGPGCLLTDVRMPGLDGLELQNRLAARQSALPVIVVTGHGDIRMTVRAMRAGALDFIEKPLNDRDLLAIVRRAIEFSRGANYARGDWRNVRRRLETLTPREREVLDLVVSGEPNKRIAFRLGISEKTVEFHRANVMAKMAAKSSADLIRSVVMAAATGGSP